MNSAHEREDLPKLFEVTFHLTQYSTAIRIIGATSVEEAREKAERLTVEDIADFSQADYDLEVAIIEPLENGEEASDE